MDRWQNASNLSIYFVVIALVIALIVSVCKKMKNSPINQLERVGVIQSANYWFNLHCQLHLVLLAIILLQAIN